MANGWTGNILRVNLTTGNITVEDSSKFKKFVGGMGFGYKIMYDEVPPAQNLLMKGINWFSPPVPSLARAHPAVHASISPHYQPLPKVI